eukprot:1020827-Prymnesium_polylepis.1
MCGRLRWWASPIGQETTRRKRWTSTSRSSLSATCRRPSSAPSLRSYKGVVVTFPPQRGGGAIQSFHVVFVNRPADSLPGREAGGHGAFCVSQGIGDLLACRIVSASRQVSACNTS